jgi:hypothetical protein
MVGAVPVAALSPPSRRGMIDQTTNRPWDVMARQARIAVAAVELDHIANFHVQIFGDCDARQWYETTTSLDKYHLIFI